MEIYWNGMRVPLRTNVNYSYFKYNILLLISTKLIVN